MFFPLLIGCFGFVLFFVYDINSITVKNPVLNLGFFIGCLSLAASTLYQIYSAYKNGSFGGAADVILLVFALLSFAALVYCLFFALPFEKTYVDPDAERKVCDVGVYGLSRHPAVIPFFFTYLFLGLAALPSQLLLNGMIFSGLNLLYVIFQDLVSFPKTFTDYGEYKKRVPFLLPDIKKLFSVFLSHQKNRKGDSK